MQGGYTLDTGILPLSSVTADFGSFFKSAEVRWIGQAGSAGTRGVPNVSEARNRCMALALQNAGKSGADSNEVFIIGHFGQE